MDDLFTSTILIVTVASGIRLATPFLLASLGEALGQRSGVLNLGVDGVMLLGAFGAYYTVLKTGNLFFGIWVGVFIGALVGIFYAFITVNLHAQQGVSGIGIYLFGLGMSDLLFQKLVGTPRPILPFPTLEIPLLSNLPVIGEMFFEHSLIVYIAFLLVPVATFVMNRTTYGMNVRAIGERRRSAILNLDYRKQPGRSGRCSPGHRIGDISAESDQCDGLYRHRPGLFRSLAPFGGDDRIPGFRLDRIHRAAVQDPGSDPPQRIRPCGDGTGDYYNSGPGFCGQPVSTAHGLDETLYPRLINRWVGDRSDDGINTLFKISI
jgi:hypothetical protein